MSDHEARLRAEHARALRLIATLEGDFDAVVEATREVSTDDEHDPEGHTIGYERAQVDAILTMTRANLAELDLALQRFQDDTHRICNGCSGPIGDERLEAQPAATLCVACASPQRRPLRR